MFSRARTTSYLFCFCALTLYTPTHAMQNLKSLLQKIGILGTGVITLQAGLTAYHDHVLEPRKHAQNHAEKKAPEHVQQQVIAYARRMRGCNPLKWIRFGLTKKAGGFNVYCGPSNDQPEAFQNQPEAEAYIHAKGGLFVQKNTFNNPLTPQERNFLCTSAVHIMKNGLFAFPKNYTSGSPDWFKLHFKRQIQATKILQKCEDYDAIETQLTSRSLDDAPAYYGTRHALRSLQQKQGDNEKLVTLCNKHDIKPLVESSWKTHYAYYLLLKHSTM